jgi:hypothetical protein
MGKKSGSGSGMNNPDHMYFLELRNHFFGLKYLNSFETDPGWKKFGSGIRNEGWKKVGPGINIPSATLQYLPSKQRHSACIF